MLGDTSSAAFDHVSQGPLEKLAASAGVRVLEKQAWSTAETFGDEGAIDALLGTEAKILLVHLSNEAWLYLLGRIDNGRVAVRFSSEGFQPGPPSSAGGGCFHCCMPIGEGAGYVSTVDLLTLVKVMSDNTAVESMMRGIIPATVRHLLSFKVPHRLRALHILIQGVLATWASDPGHPKAREIRTCLGLTSIPSIPTTDIARRSTFWKVLDLETSRLGVTSDAADLLLRDIAAELGVADWDSEDKQGQASTKAAVKALLDEICTGDAGSSLAEDVVINGFEAIKTLFERKS